MAVRYPVVIAPRGTRAESRERKDPGSERRFVHAGEHRIDIDRTLEVGGVLDYLVRHGCPLRSIALN
jgi:hypothetical protein